MTDKELLEAAAKAAGIAVEWHHGCGNAVALTRQEARDRGRLYWNPLTDDGDALRLAVALRMNIDVGTKPVGFTEASVIVDGMRIGAEEYHDADPYAATRRAIVRAAASLGAPGA